MGDEPGKIRVVIEGDSSSLQAAAAGGNKSLGDVGNAAMFAADGTKKGTVATEESGEAFLNTRQKAQMLHFELSNLGAKFPELGLLSHLLFNPLTAGFAAGALGEEAYFKWLERIEQKYHDLVAAAQKVNDAMREITASGKTADEIFVEMQQAMAKAREEGRGLAADMENDAKLADAMKEAFDASADRIAAVHKDTADLNSKLVDLLVATGRISPERGKVMDLEIQHAQKLQEFADARAKAQGDVSQAQSALGQAQRDFQTAGGGDDFHEHGIFQNKQFSDEHATRLENIITGYEKVKNAADAASRAAASDALTHSLDFGAFAKSQGIKTDVDDQMAAFQKVYEAAKAQLPDAERAKVRDDKAWDDLAKAKESINKLTNELDGLQQKLAELNASQAAQIPTINQDSATREATDLFKGGATVQSIVDSVNAPGGTATQHQEAVQNLQIVLTALGVSSSNINGIVRGLMNHTINNATEISSLKSQFDAMQSRLSHASTHIHSGFM
jgi:hypothetical protein